MASETPSITNLRPAPPISKSRAPSLQKLSNVSKMHDSYTSQPALTFSPRLLMNYTYLPSSPYSSSPTIIMTTNPSSKKTLNLISNPHVSLLVHDWVSHRPPTTARRGSRTGSPPPEASRSSLATLLLNLNTSALSSISATINGDAKLVERGTDEERYYREKHLDNNTFEGGEGGEECVGYTEEESDGGRGTFIEGEEVRVVVVKIRDGRVADWKGAVRDWTLEGYEAGERENGETLVNGVN